MKIISIRSAGIEHTWDIEVDEVHEYQLSNGCISHNTSGKACNAIESTEPISDFFYKEEGTITVPTLFQILEKIINNIKKHLTVTNMLYLEMQQLDKNGLTKHNQ